MAEIRTIAVIGAGSRGRNIAQIFALGGFRTILEDILPASLRRAEDEIRSAFQSAIEAGELTRSEADAALARINYASSIEQAAREADLVIEAVPEELESKIEIFTLLDKIARPATILAASSDSFSINELASVTYRRKKILGMIFSALPDGQQVLGLLPGRETGDGAIAVCLEVGRQIKRQVLVVKEA